MGHSESEPCSNDVLVVCNYDKRVPHYRLNGSEILQLSEDMINPKTVKLGPSDFELKKVLGKGGYGKVFQVSVRTAELVLREGEMVRWQKKVEEVWCGVV